MADTKTAQLFDLPQCSTPPRMDTEQFARLVDVTPQAVRDWIGEGMPVVVGGTRGAGNSAVIDTLAGLVWFVENKHKQLAGIDEFTRERTRLAKEQANKIAIENAISGKHLIDTRTLIDVFGPMLSNIKTRMLGLGHKVGPAANPEDPNHACSLIDEAVREALTELSEYDYHYFQSIGEHEEDEQ